MLLFSKYLRCAFIALIFYLDFGNVVHTLLVLNLGNSLNCFMVLLLFEHLKNGYL